MPANSRPRRGVFFYEAVFYEDGEGKVYSNGNIAREALTLYLACVDQLEVYCRLRKVGKGEAASLVEISADSLTFRSIGLRSWSALAIRFPWVFAALIKSWRKADVVILRLPSIISILLWPIRLFGGRPVVVELVSDPAGLLEHAYPGFIGVSVLDKIMTAVTRSWVRRSLGCIYVTRETLQALYPSGGGSTYASNVRIDEIDAGNLERRLAGPSLAEKRVLRVGLIGSLNNEYKGVDVAIEAVNRLNKAGFPVVLHVLGKGPLEDKYRGLAERLDCSEHVEFAGTKRKGKEVLGWLASMDAYIQPSRVEGLPRALVEAMSVALPCVATDIGGIPELLDRQWLVPPDDAGALAERLKALLSDETLYKGQCESNFEEAQEFLYENIVSRKRAFLESLSPHLVL